VLTLLVQQNPSVAVTRWHYIKRTIHPAWQSFH